MFKKGQKVYSILRGWGEVEEIRNGLFYPILVRFEVDTVSFTLDGKSDTAHIAPELYHTEPVITIPKRRVEHTGWIKISNDNKDFRPCSYIFENEDGLTPDKDHTIQQITYYTEE